MLTFADGEFCCKKSTIPSGIAGGSKQNAFLNLTTSLRDLVAVFFNMASSIDQDKDPSKSGINSTSNDFKLHKEWCLTSNKSGSKDRI
jgi:hypothetical protein